VIQASVGWRPKRVESLDLARARSRVGLLIIIKYLMETVTTIKSYHKKRRNQKLNRWRKKQRGKVKAPVHDVDKELQ
jgi:hypothetical protein